jgi:hypothetical protein
VFNGPNHAVDDGLQLARRHIEQRLEGLADHGLEEHEEVDAVVREALEVAGDHAEGGSEDALEDVGDELADELRELLDHLGEEQQHLRLAQHLDLVSS